MGPTDHSGFHEGIVKEVAALLAGEDIGLVLDVENLQEEIRGRTRYTDEEDSVGLVIVFRGNGSDSHSPCLT